MNEPIYIDPILNVRITQIHTYGIFEVTHVDGERWRCKNTLTSHEHVKHGTLSFVEQRAHVESALFKARMKDATTPKKGGARGEAMKKAVAARFKGGGDKRTVGTGGIG